ncbi:MAG: hypothetical protein IKE21_03055 [Erysipelotrichaceae bacterium]|nr:hypothetical protein [Erysipelotrichaceae bacterium]
MKFEQDTTWETLTYEEKNHHLYLTQKDVLEKFRERHAISQEQYDKSLHDLNEKMGYAKG